MVVPSAKYAAAASVVGLAGAALAITSGPACTFDLVEPRLDAGTSSSSSSSSGAGGSAVDDHVLCLFGTGDEARQSVSDLAAGPAGDFAMVGPLLGSMVFGETTLTNATEQDAAFIAKLDSACEVLWAKPFTSDGAVDPPVVAVDGARLIAAGSFRGAADLAGEKISSAASDTDAFVIGFDPRGAVARVLQLGGGAKQNVAAAAAAGATGWVVAGSVGDELWWSPPTADGGAPLLTAADGNTFVMRIDEVAGAFELGWVRAYGVPAELSSRTIEAVAVDQTGNIAVVGRFKGTFDFGGRCTPLVKSGDEDMFVVKLDPDGNCLWARAYGSTEEDYAHAVVFDSRGDLVFCGDFKRTVDFGAGPLSAPGESSLHNAVLVKLDANGTTIWSLGFGDAKEQHGVDLALGADDTIYITLDFDGSADFDPEHDGGEVEATPGDRDALVVSFDPDGGYRWARRYGDAASQHSHRVGVDSSGAVTLVGMFSGSLETSAGTITGDSLDDVFAMRIDP